MLSIPAIKFKIEEIICYSSVVPRSFQHMIKLVQSDIFLPCLPSTNISGDKKICGFIVDHLINVATYAYNAGHQHRRLDL